MDGGVDRQRVSALREQGGHHVASGAAPCRGERRQRSEATVATPHSENTVEHARQEDGLSGGKLGSGHLDSASLAISDAIEATFVNAGRLSEAAWDGLGGSRSGRVGGGPRQRKTSQGNRVLLAA